MRTVFLNALMGSRLSAGRMQVGLAFELRLRLTPCRYRRVFRLTSSTIQSSLTFPSPLPLATVVPRWNAPPSLPRIPLVGEPGRGMRFAADSQLLRRQFSPIAHEWRTVIIIHRGSRETYDPPAFRHRALVVLRSNVVFQRPDKSTASLLRQISGATLPEITHKRIHNWNPGMSGKFSMRMRNPQLWEQTHCC